MWFLTARIIFTAIGGSIIARLFLIDDLESTLVGMGSVLFCGSMIFYNHLWAEYILPFGFWESKASDFKQPQNSAPAVAFLGWVFLLLLGYGIFMR